MVLDSTVHRLCYGTMRLFLTPAVRFYFRRLDTVHPERLPNRGPLLIVANHPSSLTDVLVLGVLLRRRLRFVAYSGLFRIRLHGMFLRACGALPIHRREDDAERMSRNAETFAACHAAFEHGEVVVMFPEGTSREERTVESFRTGSARLALGYERMRRRGHPLRVIPVGLTFSRRGAFHSDVTVAVGADIALGTFKSPGARDSTEAVHGLTEKMHSAITDLVAQVPAGRMVPTLHAAEDLALDALSGEVDGAERFAVRRAIALGLERERRRHPERLARFERRLAAHRAGIAAVGLDDRTLAEPETPRVMRERARLLALGALGAIPALIGGALHAPGYSLSILSGVVFGRDPTRLSFARIMAGLGAFLLGYAGLGAWGYGRWGLGAAATLVMLAGCAALGLFALGYLDWLNRERRRLRLAVLAAARPRWVAAARTRRRRLLAQVSAAIGPEVRERRPA